jgi:hypothetical protein
VTDSTTQAIRYLRDNDLLRTDQEEQVWAMDGVRHRLIEGEVTKITKPSVM